MFTAHPDGMGLLLHAPPLTVLRVTLTSILGLVALSAATNGWFLRRAAWPERIALAVCGLLLAYPASAMDAIAAGGVAAVGLAQRFSRSQPAPETQTSRG